MRAAVLLALPLLASAAPPPVGEVVVPISGLRSDRGQVLACVTAAPRTFPDCRKDPAARTLVAPARTGLVLRFPAVAPGRYAVSLLHDENGNGRPDMALLLPREGFGFSRDAAVRFGPPKFSAAAFPVESAPVTVPVKVRYLL